MMMIVIIIINIGSIIVVVIHNKRRVLVGQFGVDFGALRGARLADQLINGSIRTVRLVVNCCRCLVLASGMLLLLLLFSCFNFCRCRRRRRSLTRRVSTSETRRHAPRRPTSTPPLRVVHVTIVGVPMMLALTSGRGARPTSGRAARLEGLAWGGAAAAGVTSGCLAAS